MRQIVTRLQISKPVTTFNLAILGKRAGAVMGDFSGFCGTRMPAKSIKEACQNFAWFVVAAQRQMSLELQKETNCEPQEVAGR